MGVLLPATAAQAFAKPLTDWSFYVSTSDPNAAYRLGCNQGNFDRANGHKDSETVLDFGGQNQANTGSIRINDGAFMSYATIATVAEAYARGYWECTGPTDSDSIVYLDLGTNNSAWSVDNAGGAAWARLVNTVQSFVTAHYGQVVVQGANDIEPSWASYADTLAWAQGFGANTSHLYLNYGSADGCPQNSATNGSCNNGWTQHDVWNIAYGLKPAVTAPEIYFTSQARQWTQISHYGRDVQHKAAHYLAPWDEADLAPGQFTSQQAWDNLTGMMGEPCPYSMQIHWQ
jgi:hypothetical protein